MPETTTAVRSLSTIATEIRKTWKDKTGRPCVNYAAKPYLDAMITLDTMASTYGADDAKSIVIYFLSNASTWRGDDAKRIKAELKKMAGIK
jgi:hypothetical protein